VALQLGSFVYRTADKADNDRPWHKKRSEAGRATEVIVKGSQGEKVYTNSSTRSFLNLDSQWYDITTDADIFVKGNDGEPVKTGKKVMTASGLKTVSPANGKINVVTSSGLKI